MNSSAKSSDDGSNPSMSGGIDSGKKVKKREHSEDETMENSKKNRIASSGQGTSTEQPSGSGADEQHAREQGQGTSQEQNSRQQGADEQHAWEPNSRLGRAWVQDARDEYSRHSPGSSEVIKCPQCPKRFKKLHALDQHKQNIHDGKRFQCSICQNKHFGTAQHLKQHELTHTGQRPYKCGHLLCSKLFSSQSNLNRHTQTTHNEENNFKCPKCPEASFKTAGKLSTHQKQHKAPQHKCLVEHCRKEYHTSSELNRHHKGAHTKVKEYQCAKCEGHFSTSTSLGTHVTRCTGLGAKICIICRKKYPNNSELKRHQPGCKKKQMKKDGKAAAASAAATSSAAAAAATRGNNVDGSSTTN